MNTVRKNSLATLGTAILSLSLCGCGSDSAIEEEEGIEQLPPVVEIHTTEVALFRGNQESDDFKVEYILGTNTFDLDGYITDVLIEFSGSDSVENSDVIVDNNGDLAFQLDIPDNPEISNFVSVSVRATDNDGLSTMVSTSWDLNDFLFFVIPQTEVHVNEQVLIEPDLIGRSSSISYVEWTLADYPDVIVSNVGRDGAQFIVPNDLDTNFISVVANVYFLDGSERQFLGVLTVSNAEQGL